MRTTVYFISERANPRYNDRLWAKFDEVKRGKNWTTLKVTRRHRTDDEYTVPNDKIDYIKD